MITSTSYLSQLLIAAQRRLRSEEHTSELQSRLHLVCRLLLEKKKEQIGLLSTREALCGNARKTRGRRITSRLPAPSRMPPRPGLTAGPLPRIYPPIYSHSVDT